MTGANGESDYPNRSQDFDPNSPDVSAIRIPTISLPFWSPLFGYTTEFYKRSMTYTVAGASRRANRQVTQEEADILCELVAKQRYIESLSYPIAMVVGAALAYRTRRTFRFPLIGVPNPEKFSPYAFPGLQFAFITGNSAATAWQVSRFLAYSSSSWFIVGIFSNAYAQTILNVGLTRDDRLKPWRTDVKVNDVKRGVAHGQDGSVPSKMPVTQRGTLESVISGLEAKLAALPTEEDVKNGSYSPTQAATIRKLREDGKKALEYAREALEQVEQLRADREDETEQRKDYDALNASNKPTPSGEQTWSADYGTMPQGRNTGAAGWSQSPTEQASPSQSSDDFDDLDDDASPVASSAREAPRSASPRGSAWDRIRRQTTPGVTPDEPADSPTPQDTWANQARSRAGGEQGKDGFAYSKADEEAALAKAQAQKEFDGMLDRERRGDENSASGRGRRNGSW